MPATETKSATGRRKTAVAHVRVTPGTGQMTINGLSFEDYLPTIDLQNSVIAPFQTVNMVNKFDVQATVKGGGKHAQAVAIRHAISRSLTLVDPENRKLIKPEGFLTRDPRMKERKKPGQPGARARFQFSKR
ncbi:MAG: 30S ribosomal protein S9 [Akkermansiaceae bacterium]|jgi:small subunit ribosomal protein S9|nr:30S ribosomal protein S9 [Akkermansiaceae bacterium]MDP4646403.1 30S ribosomal protein S9 [Akkermansiaceae bacterium]MDP4721520.1 30S ribosomal protein S9 [Akkermansiaceae bacterium]MDP4780006.1 30S ribosomal protein S9 [Akkermansiaceae bacterium]MDP4847068.1 30S ribosomal protein S9 [Akkermansiaceae bacterium]